MKGSKKSLLKRNDKIDEEHFKDMVNGSRKVMTKVARESYEFQCDPFRNKNKSRPQREASRRGDLRTFEFEATVLVGTSGVGWIVFAPDFFLDQSSNVEPTGPYSDVNIACWTSAGYTGAATPAVANSAITGTLTSAWSQSNYTANDTNVPRMQWQFNGGGMEIINVTNRLASDGSIYCYQSKSNAAGGFTASSITQTKSYTETSGAVYAEKGTKHVFPHKIQSVNVRSSADQESFYANGFNARNQSRSGSTGMITGGSVIFVTGTSGNSIRVRVTAGYSRIGSAIMPKKHFVADSRSADIIDNLVSLRILPSWFGYPSGAHKGFMSHAFNFIRENLNEVEKKGLPTIPQVAKKAGSFLWKELGLL